MAELTKERLTALSNRENVGVICSDEIAEMARQLLASMEQEPYGYVHKEVYEAEGSCGLSSDHEAHRNSTTHVPVYRLPLLEGLK